MTHKQKTIILSNCANGTHAGGNISYWASAAIDTRFVFGTLGGDDSHIAVAEGAKIGEHNRAIGIITDEAEGVSDLVNVKILGSNEGTLQVLAAEDIQAGALITSNDEGKAVLLSTQAAGDYFIYGIALKNTKDGQILEFTPTVGLEKTKV